MPTAEHKHCVRHLHNNFKIASHSGLALKQRLWAAARSTTIPTFEAEMEKMLSQSDAAYRWLQERPAYHWSRSHFSTHSKCDMLLNNLCESFNSAIIEARDKPILTLLERIRSYLMLRMARLRETVWKHDVGPRIFGIVEKLTTESAQCIASYAGGGKYQVNNIHGGMYVVDLERHTCTCRKWDLCGIPCSHSMAAIAKTEKSPYDFLHSLYKRGAYGRPRTSRQKEPDEIPKNATKLKRYGIVISCKSCGGEGHNSATCGAEGHTGERGGRQEQARGRGRAIRVRGRGRGTSMPSVPVRQPDQADTSIQDRPFRRTKLGARRGGQMSELTRQLAQTGATLQGIQIGHASQPNSENVPLPKRPRPWRV
ncbi:hypothetical protein ACE6H2_023281 [Prunus campanulata]